MDQTSEVAKETDPTCRDLGSIIPDMNVMRQDVPNASDPVIKPQSQHPRVTMPPPQPLNLPCGDLFVGSRQRYVSIALPLYEASVKGDWETAEQILNRQPELVRCAITENNQTALHVAASTEDNKLIEHFVPNLIKKMDKSDLELQNKYGYTALHLAAAAGSVKLAQIMVGKNSALPEIPNTRKMMPLYAAALSGKLDMVKYLYRVSKKMSGDYWTDDNRGWVLKKCVEGDMFDVAQTIATDRPELTTNIKLVRDVLEVLARKREEFNRERNVISRIIDSIVPMICKKTGPAKKDGEALQLLKIIWEKVKIMPSTLIDDIINHHPSRLLFVAVEMGNTRFIVELLRSYPDLIWKKNQDGLSIFHIAVMHRHQDIHNLLYEIGSMRHLITPLKDKKGNNMLHLVGMTSKHMRPQMSASLPMQRELMWYNEVEKMIPPYNRERKNKDGKTPYEIFSESNEDVVSQNLKWMKDCMVVATLIVTVAFAVAFTVPGGYNQNNGIPMFLHKRTFIIFVIADAITLFCSSASLLVFLSVLTSRHGQRDFMNSLPTKLMIGLVTLFISVIAMMVTFSVSFFVLYHNGLKWLPILISALATMPVILFAILQFPLLVDMFRSVYDSRYLFNPKNRKLYQVTPMY